ALLVIAVTLLGGVLGGVLHASIKPRYTSSVALLLEPKRSDSFGADTQFGSVYVDAAKIASVVSVIESTNLLDRVVASEHLDQFPEFGDPTPSLLRKWLAKLPFVTVPAVENDQQTRTARAAYHLDRAMRVERIGVTYVLTIDVSASQPEIAQRVAGAVADSYLDEQVERKTAATQRDSAWLSDRLAELRQALMASEATLDAARRKYGLMETDLGPGATMDRQTLTEMNAQLSQAQADVANLRARYEQAEQARASGRLEGLPEVGNSRVIEGLRATQADVAQKLATLHAIYNDNFPDVRHLEETRRVIQAQIAAETGRIVEARHADYDAAVAREQALSDRLRHASTDAGPGSVGAEAVRNAQRVVDADRGLYDALVIRWRELQQQQTREEPEGRIISQASLADRPSWPKPLLLPVGGAAAMLFFSLVLTLVPPLLDNRFVSVIGVEQRLGLSVLGALPLLRRRDLALARRRQSIVDYAIKRPLSRFAENLRMLRAYLCISTDGASNIVQVTSAVPGEGKSTVAAALAVSAASAGIRTVLVDADVRTSTVSAMFGLRHEDGLADILELGLAPASVIRTRDDIPLAILGAGSALVPRPDLINSARFEVLLHELARTHSLVILDSPPVLAVSDALVMSRHADATILVVQWRATTQQVADQAVKMLRAVDAPLAGVMLNKIDLSRVRQYEGGYADYAHAGGKAY
ncbi:MAG: polysaccharide biosynthesis tyrosine autokinase, partial [Casimicrobiaceae bacterium]